MKKYQTPFAGLLKACSLLLTFFYSQNISAQFTTGNLVAWITNAVGVTTVVGNPIVLLEYNTSGANTYSFMVPSTGTNALINSGSATSEGYLSLSADKKYLVFGAYVRSLPNTTPLQASTASIINRGIGMVSGPGSYSLVATSASFFSTNNIRSAAAIDNNSCWGAGSSQGVNYFGPVSPGNVENTKTNLRALNIFNNQLYCSAQVASGTPTDIGIYQIGTGTPVTAGQTASCIIVTGTGSQPGQFFFNSANTICYVADGRNNSSGGIQKWVNSAGTWSLSYTLPTGTTAVGAFGVVADFSGTNPKVYATTNEVANNRLIAISDAGAASTATTIVTCPVASTFRGLAFSPCSVPALTVTGSNNICADQTLSLNVAAAGAGTYTYSWNGPGVFSSTTSANPSVTNPASGNYTVTVSNACGSAVSSTSVTINPLPAVTANSITVCTGQPATLTANGANSYSWSTGSPSSTTIVTPLVPTIYTVTGTSSFGCVQTITTQVVTVTSPTVTVNSPPVCSGNTVMLMAGGATTFTWSTGTFLNSVVVSPASTTNYTVSGSLAGCLGTSSAVATVFVLPSPTLSIAGGSVTCSGTPLMQTVSGADTYLWSTGSASPAVTFTPISTTTYSVTGTNINGCSSQLTGTITIITAPSLTVTSTEPSYLCAGQAATLAASGAQSYSWAAGPVSQTLVITPMITTTYNVTGSLGVNCSATRQFVQNVDICAGFEHFSKEGDLNLYPNPANSNIQINPGSNNASTVSIINARGEVVLTVNDYETNTSIDISHMQKGLYIVLVENGKKQSVKMLIIE